MASKYGTKVNKIAAGCSAIRPHKAAEIAQTGKSLQISDFVENLRPWNDRGALERPLGQSHHGGVPSMPAFEQHAPLKIA